MSDCVAQFDDYKTRCNLVEDELMTLCRFRRGQNDDLKKELVREVTTLDQAYALAQNYETAIKSQLVKQPDTRCSSNPLSSGSKPSVVPPQSKLYYSNVSVSKDENGKRMASEPLILNSQVRCFKCQGFDHVAKCSNKALVIYGQSEESD